MLSVDFNISLTLIISRLHPLTILIRSPLIIKMISIVSIIKSVLNFFIFPFIIPHTITYYVFTIILSIIL